MGRCEALPRLARPEVWVCVVIHQQIASEQSDREDVEQAGYTRDQGCVSETKLGGKGKRGMRGGGGGYQAKKAQDN